MNLLLDTQALLWFVLDEPRLSKAASSHIMKTEGVVYVSPASLWEVAIKVGLGKYKIPASFEDFWEEQLSRNSFTLLPLSISHLARVSDLPHVHRDPFDRLIISQSLVEDLPIVSSDVLFDDYGVVRIW